MLLLYLKNCDGKRLFFPLTCDNYPQESDVWYTVWGLHRRFLWYEYSFINSIVFYCRFVFPSIITQAGLCLEQAKTLGCQVLMHFFFMGKKRPNSRCQKCWHWYSFSFNMVLSERLKSTPKLFRYSINQSFHQFLPGGASGARWAKQRHKSRQTQYISSHWQPGANHRSPSGKPTGAIGYA